MREGSNVQRSLVQFPLGRQPDRKKGRKRKEKERKGGTGAQDLSVTHGTKGQRSQSTTKTIMSATSMPSHLIPAGAGCVKISFPIARADGVGWDKLDRTCGIDGIIGSDSELPDQERRVGRGDLISLTIYPLPAAARYHPLALVSWTRAYA